MDGEDGRMPNTFRLRIEAGGKCVDAAIVADTAPCVVRTMRIQDASARGSLADAEDALSQGGVVQPGRQGGENELS